MSAVRWSTWRLLLAPCLTPSSIVNLTGFRSPSRCTPLHFSVAKFDRESRRSSIQNTLQGFGGIVFSRAFHVSKACSARASNTAPNRKQSGNPIRNSADTHPLPMLPARAIDLIFKKGLSREEGNQLLKTLQTHRIHGTLDADIGYPPKLIDAGLRFLRLRYHIDEDVATLARIDRELDTEFALPQSDVENSRHARSHLEELRARNEARAKISALKSPEASSGGNSTYKGSKDLTNVSAAQTKLTSGQNERKPEAAWIRRYREQEESRKYTPSTLTDRLVPSGLFTLAVVISSLLFASNYNPPSPSARAFPDIPPAAAALLTIVGLNVAVFLAWRVPTIWAFMNRYFLIVPVQPKAFSMLLAEFSHQKPAHLIQNMALIWFLGLKLHDDVGRGSLLALICSSAVLTSYTTMVVYSLSGYLGMVTLGASGIVCAMLGSLLTLLTISVPFLPKDYTSSWNTGIILLFFIARELFQLSKGGLHNTARVAKRGFAIDNVGHVAGLITGAAGALLIRQADSRWKNLERNSFWYSRQSKKTSIAEDNASCR